MAKVQNHLSSLRSSEISDPILIFRRVASQLYDLKFIRIVLLIKKANKESFKTHLGKNELSASRHLKKRRMYDN